MAEITDYELIQSFVDSFNEEDKPPINIVMHSSPDPDAVGSALGMQAILRHYNFDSTIYYDGEISHPQNKTIVNVLNVVLEKTDKEIEGVNVCVDCTPHNSMAKDAKLIVDHHKSTNFKNVKYKIIHPAYGACSTIVWELIRNLKIELPESDMSIATALLLGIRTDTSDLISENITDEDFIAYRELLELSDKEAIQKVMNYPFPKYLYDKRLVLHKDGNSYESNGIFVGGVGYISATQRDSIAILSEEYARMESVQTAVIFAIVDRKYLEVSVRSSNVSLDVNQEMKSLFGEYGGGSSYKGGARVPLNFYSGIGDKSGEFWKTTCEHMFEKVLKEEIGEKK